MRNLCVGVESKDPYFFEESEPRSSLNVSLFLSCLWGFLTEKMYRHSYSNLTNNVNKTITIQHRLNLILAWLGP